jgi:type I restriction enzyme S subunit
MVAGTVLTSTRETISEKAATEVFRGPPLPPGTMLMSFKLTIGKVVRLGVPAYHNEAIVNLRPHVAEMDPYLFAILPMCAQAGATKSAIKGATLNRESLSRIPIPLPPLEEQQRIVAKLSELMALCDQLAEAQVERESRRDQLRGGSLSRLVNPPGDSEDVGRAREMRFFLSHSSQVMNADRRGPDVTEDSRWLNPPASRDARLTPARLHKDRVWASRCCARAARSLTRTGPPEARTCASVPKAR